LRNHPGVVDAGVVGLPNEQYSEVVSALIELDPRSEASPPTVEGITLYIRNHLAAYKVPRNIVVASHIPRHQNGKLDHGAVREAILASILDDSRAALLSRARNNQPRRPMTSRVLPLRSSHDRRGPINPRMLLDQF
jgi:acyl-CoA synthetase (AMP-forming)/AMP-acid ligase II